MGMQISGENTSAELLLPLCFSCPDVQGKGMDMQSIKSKLKSILRPGNRLQL